MADFLNEYNEYEKIYSKSSDIDINDNYNDDKYDDIIDELLKQTERKEENPEMHKTNIKNTSNINSSTKVAKKAPVNNQICLNQFNDFFHNKFEELASKAVSRDPSNKLSFVYKKVCSSIKRYPFPIVSSKNYYSLKGVGNNIATKFEEYLTEYKDYLKLNNSNVIEMMRTIQPKALKKIIKVYESKKESIQNNSSDNNSVSSSKEDKINTKLKNEKKVMLKDELKKKQKINHITPYSGLWTALIASYFLFLQDNKLTISIKDIIETSNILKIQFEGSIALTEPNNDDIYYIKVHDFLDSGKLQTYTQCGDKFFNQTLNFKQNFQNFCKNELEKSGIIISVVETQVNIDLADDYKEAVNNRISSTNKISDTAISLSMNNFEEKIISSYQTNVKKAETNSRTAQTINKYLYSKSNLKVINEDSNNKNLNSSHLLDSQKGNNTILEESNKSNRFIQKTLETDMLGNSEIETLYTKFFKSNEGKSKFKVFLIIDNREFDHQGVPVHEFIKFHDSLGIYKSKKASLSLGDLLWTVYDEETENEYVLDFIVERKTLDDLAKSIVDGRYKEQKCRLKTCGISNIYYLIENCKFDSKYNSVTKDTVNTAVMNILNVFDINIIKSESIKNSVEILEEMDLNVRKWVNFQYKSKGNSMYEDFIPYENFQKNNQKARNISISKIFYRQLSCFDGCGEKAINLLKKWFNTPTELYVFLNSITNSDTRFDIFDALSVISNRVENQNKSFIGSVDNLNKAKTLAESSYKLKREKKESKSKKLNQNLIDVVIDFYVQKDS